MAHKVPYREQTINTPNPVARFAHRQRYKFSLERVAEDAPRGGTVLEYGCGEGYFLTFLARVRPDLRLYGYDPESTPSGKGFSAVESLNAIGDGSIDFICCYETLEHLYTDEIAFFLGHIKRVLSENGRVSISVPIIGGPPLLLKEANRSVLFRRKSDYTASELLAASLLGKPAPRPDHIRLTHKGFNFRSLAGYLSKELELVSKHWSPFPMLPWWLNSQAFYLYKKT